MKLIKLLSFMLVVLMLTLCLFACTPGTTPPDDPDVEDPSDDPTDDPSEDGPKDTGFKIAGTDISEYIIVTNMAITQLRSSADVIKGKILEKAGVTAYSYAAAQEGKKTIYIKEVQQAGKSGFRVSVVDGNLLIECAYRDLTPIACGEFWDTVVAPETTTELAADFTYQAPIKTVKYEDFGAVGDGVTDDYQAIKKAHDEANKYGYIVEGKAGATYLIGAKGWPSVTILTDTDWKGANFIIDDRSITEQTSPSHDKPLFKIMPSMKSLEIKTTDVPSLAKGASKLGYAPGVDCLVYVQYNGVKHYIREGANANSGAYQQEILLVRADGSIDKNTRPIWDYPEINKIWAVPVDEIEVTVQNGNFKTLANEINPDKYISVDRGIVIQRSNTTIKNVNHTVVQTKEYRAAYAGFFKVSNSNNVLIYDCEIFCHKGSYFTNDKNQKVLLGSYELSAGHSNNVRYEKVVQTNFFTNEEKTAILDQGLMGTNYCKNMYVKNSTFARFDAHCQVYNLTVTGSNLQRVNTIGFGTVKIENTNIWGSYLADLRSDYGGLFGGDFHLKNVTMKYQGGDRIALFSGSWKNHYYGYQVIQPQNIYIDNLVVERDGEIYLYTSGLDNKADLTGNTVSTKPCSCQYCKPLVDEATANGVTDPNLNPIVPTKLVEFKSNPAGTAIKVNKGKTFENVEVKYPTGQEGVVEEEKAVVDAYLVNCGFSSGISVNGDGFVTSASPDKGGKGSVRVYVGGNNHDYLNIRLTKNGNDQALLFSGSGNPNGVTKGTNICVDVYPTSDQSYTDPDVNALYKGKSFVVAFDIKPLEKTSDLNDGKYCELFTFCNYYSTNPGFVQGSMIRMNLTDYSLYISASGNRPAIDLNTKLEVGKFSTLALHVNVPENKFDFYVNGVKLAENLPFLNDTEISYISVYDESGDLVPSTKANKMEDFLMSYARLARINGWEISSPVYEFDNAKLYYTDGNQFLGTGDLKQASGQ